MAVLRPSHIELYAPYRLQICHGQTEMLRAILVPMFIAAEEDAGQVIDDAPQH
jgi:hypothetical protein